MGGPSRHSRPTRPAECELRPDRPRNPLGPKATGARTGRRTDCEKHTEINTTQQYSISKPAKYRQPPLPTPNQPPPNPTHHHSRAPPQSRAHPPTTDQPAAPPPNGLAPGRHARLPVVRAARTGRVAQGVRAVRWECGPSQPARLAGRLGVCAGRCGLSQNARAYGPLRGAAGRDRLAAVRLGVRRGRRNRPPCFCVADWPARAGCLGGVVIGRRGRLSRGLLVRVRRGVLRRLRGCRRFGWPGG